MNHEKKIDAFRTDIEGLRAVAALLVAVYHIWFAKVSGGVDVFFVVSGFLITHSLLNQWSRYGHLRPADFWLGLFRRLIPQAALVVLITSLGCAFLLAQTDWFFNAYQAISALTGLNNWHLAFNAVDYLARTARVSPYQHFWALSAQWQFYVIWPSLFGAVAIAARAAGIERLRALQIGMFAMFAVSLLYSVFETARNQPFAYFNTAARIWEFAIGGMLALKGPQLLMHDSLRNLLGWVGLIALLICGQVIPVASSFPGYAALFPTIAAILVLLAGGTASKWSVSRLLSWKPLVAFGGISYGFYLWHWPLLVFWMNFTNEGRASVIAGGIIMVVSGILAWGTTRLFSSRSKARAPSETGVRSAPVLFCTSLAFCFLWLGYADRTRAAQRVEPVPGPETHPGARVLMTGAATKVEDAKLFPGPFRVRDDLPVAYADGCHQTATGHEAKSCVYGDPDGHLTVALVGGSHAVQWLPALDAAGRDNGWRVVNVTKSGCLLRGRPVGGHNKVSLSCDAWNEALVRVLQRLEPELVVTTGTRRDADGEFLPPDYIAAWERFASARTKVLAVRDNPRFPFDVPLCVDVHGPYSHRCWRPVEDVLGSYQNPVLQADAIPNVLFEDFVEYFCTRSECFPTAGNVLIYRDDNHITSTYIRSLQGPVAEAIRRALEWRAQQINSVQSRAGVVPENGGRSRG